MANSNVEDYLILELNTGNIRIKDASGQYMSDAGTALSSARAMAGAIQKRLESALGSKVKLDYSANTGSQVNTLKFTMKDTANAKSIADSVIQYYEGNKRLGDMKSPLSSTAQWSNALKVSFEKRNLSQSSLSALTVEANRAGGWVEELPSNIAGAHRARVSYITTPEEFESLGASGIFKTYFPKTQTKMAQDRAYRREQENAAIERENKAAQRKQEIEEKRSRKEEERRTRAEIKAKEIEDKRLAREEQLRAKEEEENSPLGLTKRMLLMMGVAGSALGILVDLTRRILSSVIDISTKSIGQAIRNNEMSVEARALGIPMLNRRSMDIFDIAHGMEAGTTYKGIYAMQQMFGDKTNLNTKAMEVLGRVMGAELEEAVRVGDPNRDPEKFYNLVLEKYFKQYLSGRNSLGEYVGRHAAGRELITSLQSVTPELAKAFARAITDYESGTYNFADIAGWKGTTPTNWTGLTELEMSLSTEVAKNVNQIIAMVQDIKDSFFTRLANETSSIITKIKNLRVGATATENFNLDDEHRAINERNKAALLQYTKETEEEGKIASFVADLPISEDVLSKVNKSKAVNAEDVRGFRYTLPILAGIASGRIDMNELQAHRSDYGIAPLQEGAYHARAWQIISELALDPELADDIAFAVAADKSIAAITKENKKVTDVDEVEATQNKIAFEALEFLNSIRRGTLQVKTLDKFQNKNISNIIHKARERAAASYRSAGKNDKAKAILNKDVSDIDWYSSLYNKSGTKFKGNKEEQKVYEQAFRQAFLDTMEQEFSNTDAFIRAKKAYDDSTQNWSGKRTIDINVNNGKTTSKVETIDVDSTSFSGRTGVTVNGDIITAERAEMQALS